MTYLWLVELWNDDRDCNLQSIQRCEDCWLNRNTTRNFPIAVVFKNNRVAR